jgi:Domain of unknown function (DU1801)
MTTKQQIKHHLSTLPDSKRIELQTLHEIILQAVPKCKLWFFDGKNEQGKVVANPNIGYGSCVLQYVDGSTKEFYKIGLCATATGISIYVMGLEDKNYLSKTYKVSIGKATFTSYCIKFKKLMDMDGEVFVQLINEQLGTNNDG